MHVWSFFRAGGFDQVRLERAADLSALADLDPKLWLTLACPTHGLEFDARTLELVDTDHDRRIRLPEIVAASSWVVSCLKDPETLFQRKGALALSNLRDDTAEGRALLRSARQILRDLGRPDATEITVDDTTDTTRIFASTRFNGDGVVPPAAADEADLRAALDDVLARMGGVPDRGGALGVDRARIEAFFDAVAATDGWWSAADGAVLPLGDATPAAHEALVAVADKIDDFFARVRLAAFDPRAADVVNRPVEELAALAARDLRPEDPEVARLPLARVAADAVLPLGAGVNPAWSARMATFRSRVVTPLLGPVDALDEAGWTSLRATLAPYAAWRAKAPEGPVSGLPPERIRELAAGDLRARALALVAEDEALKEAADAITAVDRLVRYHRDLVQLLDNFVSFRDFYTKRDKAIFQVGTLYLDQRSVELCLRVDDVGPHAALAGRAGTFLAYCDVVRRATGEKMTIAAAITGGDADNLMVGRNGLFVDRRGRDWDATVVRIVDHPISLRQAFWSPYKKFGRLVEQQIEKFASSKSAEIDAASEANAAAAHDAVVKTAAPTPTPTPAAPTPAFDVAKFAGIFAAIGLAIGAIGGAIGAIVTALAALAWWKLPLVVCGAMLLVSGPSVLMAALKLRKRNLAPLLDASGWAINASAKMNIPFGESLTGLARLPKGARRKLDDPFAESRRGRVLAGVGLVGATATALWWFGVLEPIAPWLPDSPREEVAAQAAAAAPAPTAEASTAPTP